MPAGDLGLSPHNSQLNQTKLELANCKTQHTGHARYAGVTGGGPSNNRVGKQNAIFDRCYLVLPIFSGLGLAQKYLLVAVSVLIGCAARGWGQESHSDVEKTFRDL